VRVDSTFRGGSDGEGKLHEAKRMAFDETVLGTVLPKGSEGIPDVGVDLCAPLSTPGTFLGKPAMQRPLTGCRATLDVEPAWPSLRDIVGRT